MIRVEIVYFYRKYLFQEYCIRNHMLTIRKMYIWFKTQKCFIFFLFLCLYVYVDLCLVNIQHLQASECMYIEGDK